MADADVDYESIRKCKRELYLALLEKPASLFTGNELELFGVLVEDKDVKDLFEEEAKNGESGKTDGE